MSLNAARKKRVCQYGENLHFSSLNEIEKHFEEKFIYEKAYSTPFDINMSPKETLARIDYLKDTIIVKRDYSLSKDTSLYSLSYEDIAFIDETSRISQQESIIHLIRWKQEKAKAALAEAEENGSMSVTFPIYSEDKKFHIDVVRAALGLPIGIEKKPKPAIVEHANIIREYSKSTTKERIAKETFDEIIKSLNEITSFITENEDVIVEANNLS